MVEKYKDKVYEKNNKISFSSFKIVFFLLTIFFLSFSFSSCNISSFTDKKLDCSSGSQGLSSFFEEKHYILKENSDSILKVFLYNKGVFDSEGILKLKYNTDLFDVKSFDYKNNSFVDSNKILFFIEGKKPYNNCVGDKNIFLFKIKPYSLPLSVNKFDQELNLDLCYHYGFNFSSKICVQKNLGLNALEESCTPKEQFFSGQGSPLVIYKISKPEFSNGIVKFKVFFKNEGEGFITADKNVPNSIEEACNLENNINNYVFIKGFLDNYRLDCSTINSEIEGKTKLLYSFDNEENSYYVECKAENVSLESTREMFLNLQLFFYYVDRNVDSTIVTISN